MHHSVIPKHVGFIPDGSRRWSRREGSDYGTGYAYACEVIGSVVDSLFLAGVEEVSVYLLSHENMSRPQHELELVQGAFEKAMRESWSELRAKHQLSVRHVGSKERLSEGLYKAICLATAAQYDSNDKAISRRWLNYLIDYSPLDEITQAMRQSNSDWMSHLSVQTPVDLIVRTAGVCTLSNFLLWQSGYAILWTTKGYVQDLTSADVASALDYFSRIERKMGT